jgi:hypothetical protein
MEDNIPLILLIGSILFTGLHSANIFPYGPMLNNNYSLVGVFCSEFFATIGIIFTLGPIKVFFDI